jgi:hypothetical protein
MVGFVTIVALVAVTVGFCVYYIRSAGAEPYSAAARRRDPGIGGSAAAQFGPTGLVDGSGHGGTCHDAGGGWDGGGSMGDGGGGGGGSW